MQAKGLADTDLRRAVKLFDPIANAHGLKGKKVWLHLGRRDKVLDYKITVKTKEAFEAAGLHLKYTESKYLGHYGTGAKHMLGIKKINQFYNS
jgi:predicted esterase